MELKGAQILIEAMLEQGVDTVFCYPGGTVLDIFDALYGARDRIRQVLTCHEQGASHAADGYARVTGKAGTVIATSGPGATNLVTGIANAYMDSVPMVAITGNVALPLLGRDTFQEIDITGVTMPITKHNFIVKDINELADTVREAYRIAESGRPGPVLIDIPKDIQQAKCEYSPKKPVPSAHKPARENELAAAAELIAAAKKPLIYCGGGIIMSGATAALTEFAEKLDAPVALSMMGLGGFPASHPLYLGLIGMHGKGGIAKALDECDLLIVLGARFSDRVTGDKSRFAARAKKLHIDIDNAEINKNVAVDAAVMADVGMALSALNKRIKHVKRDEWRREVDALMKKYVSKDSNYEVSPQLILRTLNKLLSPDSIVATDVGQHQMWTAQLYNFERPRTFITSGGLGTMGFGLGAAIGASIGSGKPVALITGDGCFHMNMNEIVTAVVNKLPLTVIIFNNNVLGMVRQWQKLFYGSRFSSTTLNRPTDYVKLAEAMGARGMRITKNSEIEGALREALKTNGPCVIDCVINSDDNVLPMIPAGKSADDLILEM